MICNCCFCKWKSEIKDCTFCFGRMMGQFGWTRSCMKCMEAEEVKKVLRKEYKNNQLQKHIYAINTGNPLE